MNLFETPWKSFSCLHTIIANGAKSRFNISSHIGRSIHQSTSNIRHRTLLCFVPFRNEKELLKLIFSDEVVAAIHSCAVSSHALKRSRKFHFFSRSFAVCLKSQTVKMVCKLWLIIHPSFRCTVVLFNSKKLSQTYLLNTSRKAITAVAYSQCGRYLATGECGINPTIKVWELDLSPGNESNCGGTVITEFSGHKYAVNCVVS